MHIRGHWELSKLTQWYPTVPAWTPWSFADAVDEMATVEKVPRVTSSYANLISRLSSDSPG